MLRKQRSLNWIIIMSILIIIPLTMGNKGCWGQKMVDYDDGYYTASGSSGDGGGSPPPPPPPPSPPPPPPTSSNTWTERITIDAAGSPLSRTGHSMVWDGQRVIMFGGSTVPRGNGPAGPLIGELNDLWWYDPNTNTWTEQIANGVVGSPPARIYHSMVWDGTRVIMFGGFGLLFYNDLWWYDPNTNTWTEQIAQVTPGSPLVRASHSMVWDGTRVIMFGGGVIGQLNNELWWYDPGTNTWTQQIANLAGGSPNTRIYHSMVWDGTRVIMFGGQELAGPQNDLWSYDPGTNTWTEQIANNTPGSPPDRSGTSMSWDGTRVIMFAGSSLGGGIVGELNDLWWYDPSTNTWTEQIVQDATGSPPTRAYYPMIWNGREAIIFGGQALNTTLNDLWSYNP